MLVHAEDDIVMANPSFCPSHCGIVSKKMHISNFFHNLVGAWLVSLSTTAITKSWGNSLSGGV